MYNAEVPLRKVPIAGSGRTTTKLEVIPADAICAITSGLPTTQSECAPSTGFACMLLARARGLPPTLQFWPKLGQGAEFRTPAKEYVDLFFQSVGVVRRGAHVLHFFP